MGSAMIENDSNGPPIVPGRSCGKCSLCCKVLRVSEIDKPANTWCGHCRPGRPEGGCSIYETRPGICRTYACGWLMSEALGEEWYPLRSHMVLTLAPLNDILTCTVTVDGDHPGAWREEPYYSQLKRMATRGLHVKTAEQILLVQVRIMGRVWLMTDEADIDITTRSYVVKLSSSGFAIELFTTPEQASERVNELTNH
jgi:uncharacterized protein